MQRHKEYEADYRYFPEPDLVPVVVSSSEIETARNAMGELPADQRKRLQEMPYNLSPYDAEVLSGRGRKLVAYFEKAASATSDPKAVCNWVTNEVLASLRERSEEINQFPIGPDRLAGLVAESKSGLKREKAREVYQHMLEKGTSAKDAMDGCSVSSSLAMRAPSANWSKRPSLRTRRPLLISRRGR